MKEYIDKEINIYTGAQAEMLISQRNDSKYIENDSILKVDKERWLEAQYYERKTWMQLGTHLSDDRNYEHFQRFNGYENLLQYEETIKTAIELGCGPFTNLRTISSKLRNLSEVHLLDPLINDYLNHPNCSYKNKSFLNYKTVLHDCSIEQFEITQKYDLVLMNNVLEHCYDVNIIFENIFNMLNDGGIFVFSDVYFKKEDVSRMCFTIYDTGHPIKLSEDFMNLFLSKFDILFNIDFDKLHGQEWRHDKYFIGKK
jgi:SAM-dependent methyltransferase